MNHRLAGATAALLLTAGMPAHAWREGDHDPSFNAGDNYTVPFSAYLSSSLRPSALGLARTQNGRYVTAVSFQDAAMGNYSAVLYRVLADGTADTSFNATGVKKVIDSTVAMTAMTTDTSNDDIVLVGGNQSASSTAIVVCRYSANGAIDNNLIGHNGVGCIEIPISTFGTHANVLNVHAVAVQSWDHRIVIGGDVQILNGASSVVKGFVLRLFEPGSLDTGFNSPLGYQAIDLATNAGTSTSVLTLAFDVSERVLAGGYAFNGTNEDFAAARLTTTGAFDNTCGAAGTSQCTATKDFAGAGNYADNATSIAPGQNGTTYLAGLAEYGYNATYNMRLFSTAVLRLTPRFELDPDFGGAGGFNRYLENNTTGYETNTPPTILAFGSTRNFVAGGNGSHVIAARYTNGGPDPTYGNGTEPYAEGVSVTAAPNGGTGEFPYGQTRMLFDADKPVIAAVTGIAGNPSAIELSVARLLGDDTIFGTGFEH